jgi:hypothetical protein
LVVQKGKDKGRDDLDEKMLLMMIAGKTNNQMSATLHVPLSTIQ